MSTLLEKAIREVQKLPEEEQNELASVILEEIRYEKLWNESFKKSQEKLSQLANEALEEFKTGKTQPLADCGEIRKTLN